MCQGDFQPILRQQCGKPIGPLDGGHGSVVEVFAQSDGRSFRFVAQAIEIDVDQREPAAVFVDQDEGRTADFLLRQAQAAGDAPHERRLACSEFTL